MLLYEAMRVTFWGWALLLASLVLRRALDLHMKRHLRPDYVPIKLPERPALLWLSGCLCTVVLSTYTRIIADSLRGLPRSDFTVPELFASTTAFMVATAICVTLLSYHRKFKAKWMAGWSALSLIIVTVQVLW